MQRIVIIISILLAICSPAWAVEVDHINGIPVSKLKVINGVSITKIKAHNGFTLASPLTCQVDYAPSMTVDQNLTIGATAWVDFAGFLYTPTANKSVCAIDMYIKAIDGTMPDGMNIHWRIFAIDANRRADSVLGTSVAVAADLMVVSTWTSANAGLFTFDTDVELTSGTQYAFCAFVDTDGNLTDDPEIDVTNKVSAGYDNGSSVDTIGGGRISYTYGESFPYVIYGEDSTDDVLIKIYTKQ
jgi:hypothetical protein